MVHRIIATHRINPRHLAFLVLDAHFRTEEFVAPLLDAQLQHGSLDADDRRLVMEMVYGVVRRRATLDALVEPHVRRPRNRVEAGLWTLMQLGAYQLAFLASVPAHAAVHETVEVARLSGHPQWKGFLNGVLRRVSEGATESLLDKPAADAVPLTGGQYRKWKTGVFPDPRTDSRGYIAAAFSFPQWLIDRWGGRYDFQELVRLGFWFNAPAVPYLRVNELRTSRGQVLDALAGAGIDAHAGALPISIRLPRTIPVRELPGFDRGWFTVQDESAIHVAALLNPQSGESILDLCAAPGTKTTAVAERMRNTGRIVATDTSADRLPLIAGSCQRLGIGIVEPLHIHADLHDVPAGPFDAALVDVPCSNTGVLGKRPEARWRITAGDLAELTAIQRRLLAAALDRVKSGGRVVYSTCSIEPEENTGVLQHVLESRADVVLESIAEHRPGQPADGGFQALLRRM